MQQVKIFKSIESDLDQLEETINQWARQQGAKILSITGNIAAHGGAGQRPMSSFSSADVLVIVLYETDN